MNFNNYDDWEALIAYLQEKENTTAEELRETFDLTELEIVEWFAEDNGLISSENELSERFDSDIWPILVEQGMTEDYPAIREEFNNWSDSLCRDGELHELQYSEYTYSGWEARAAFL